jgi:hypothetical protein
MPTRERTRCTAATLAALRASGEFARTGISRALPRLDGVCAARHRAGRGGWPAPRGWTSSARAVAWPPEHYAFPAAWRPRIRRPMRPGVAVCPLCASSVAMGRTWSAGHCSMVGEVKKGRYVYGHCTGYGGKCPGPCRREEIVERQIAGVLRDLVVPPQLWRGCKRSWWPPIRPSRLLARKRCDVNATGVGPSGPDFDYWRRGGDSKPRHSVSPREFGRNDASPDIPYL